MSLPSLIARSRLVAVGGLLVFAACTTDEEPPTAPVSCPTAPPAEWTLLDDLSSITGPVDPFELTLLVDARRPTEVYAAHRGGLARSDDCGGTWRALPGAPQGGVMAPGLDAGTLVVASHGVWLGEERGDRWTGLALASGLAQPLRGARSAGGSVALVGSAAPASLFHDGMWRTLDVQALAVVATADGFLFLDASGGTTLTDESGQLLDASAGAVSSSRGVLAVAPSEPAVVYAAIGDVLMRSDDGGHTWGPSLPLGGEVLDLAVDAGDSELVYWSIQDRASDVLVSRDGGASSVPLEVEGIVDDNTSSDRLRLRVAAHPTQPGVIAVVSRTLFRSDDGGVTWGAEPDLSLGLSRPDVFWVGDRLALASTGAGLWVDGVVDDFVRGEGLFADGDDLFMQLGDRLAVLTNAASPPAYLEDPWPRPPFSWIAALAPETLLVAGAVPARSFDGGVTWLPWSRPEPLPGSITQTASSLVGVSIDGNVVVSTTSGESFTGHSERGLVAADPISDVVYVVAPASSTVYRSGDGGRTLELVDGTGLAVDPNDAAAALDARRDALYVYSAAGLFVSVDGGGSFDQVAESLPAVGDCVTPVLELSVVPADPPTVVVAGCGDVARIAP